MADGLNRVLAMGNLGADAELRGTDTPVLSFRIGCTETYFDRNRQKQEKTEWVSCVLFGKRATALASYLLKGKRVMVEGRLQTSSYEDRDGNKRYKTQVSVTNLILLSGGDSRGGGKSGAASTGGGGGGGAYSDEDYGSREGDDDIPFGLPVYGPLEPWNRAR